MIKRLVLALIFLVIVVGGLVSFNIWRTNFINNMFANMPKQVQTVSTITVEPSVWTPGIEAIGTANAINGVDLTVQLSGIVDKISFNANQRVKQGDILLQMEDSIQKADLASAEAQALLAQQNLKRADILRARGVGTVSEVDTTVSSAAAADAQVEKMRATLDQKMVKAPFSGIIGIPKIDLGQYLTPGTVIATLQNLDRMRVDFTVPEQMLPLVKLGQAVQVGPSADTREFKGEIVGIDPKIDPSSRLVSIRAIVENPDHKLTPGQFVQVRIELPVEHDVLALPQTAVISSLYGDYVFAVRSAEEQQGEGNAAPIKPGAENLVANQVFVKLGRRHGMRVEVLSGVKPGDVIITAGQNRLSHGMPVTINNSVNPANTPPMQDSGAEQQPADQPAKQ
ncbi:efflux RND transporter periplasmic adaptor subunit [Daeguia caeni]|uniref:Efflux RND transporter periplasmic adaptor subunit n=1 Tax=Daeguia caeni TaxID=439612 RepID=A0ABV9H3R6_9HYPH